MDVQTAVRQIVSMCHTSAEIGDSNVTDQVMRALSESLKYNRAQQTHFNVKNLVIGLETNKYVYDLPEDYTGLVGEVMYSSDLTNTNGQVPLIHRDWDLNNEFRGVDVAYVTDLCRTTMGYSIDDPGKRIYISGGDQGYVKIRYVADLGTIRYKHDGSSWIFYKPFTETPITYTSTYTNSWFTEGFDATVHRACYYLWTREMGGTDEANAKASIHLGQWREAMDHLTRETTRKKSGRSIKRYI